MAKPTIIPVSFKDNIEDNLLYDWLEGKFIQFGSKSNYIKFILRKEMQRELEKNKEE